ncbi:putative PRONE domain, Rop guanine nucleotide exchange factor [Helianthus annuus]|uniref:PRONE domain, Rop guanine nucleotide exchange factor n=3 Tax=Helianthus annuus TaxID=4232 RepID=A0A9K3EJY4_HELAN|nr:rop guanine nucleotide exchange factor 14 isoform X2 [Helianthus annuus]KAF5774503.1 putative PRONE domain, Rop guanine nucleotide exchange factor [Helianthus annuus]KAJ0477848.1 putative PRONE domain, Rop guanine nucleotide exchange factor [Helianthus annuus]KAJ0482441.1 putative PRONE domain, Rop guanine nucleotide exchange factor [Helianthus annuus]KAJ0498676.1 putative PRONE domain, Rop guanine nucleotide exchange factor [Helianthus annuus]KAJ0664690.1 putative PRONE domain, Rop guanine
MVLLRRRLSCCTWNRGISNSMDFDQPQDRIMTYNGLESCILNANSYDNESVASKEHGCPTDSPSSCCSSNNPSGSSFSQWSMMKRDENEHGLDEWDDSEGGPQQFITKEKLSYTVKYADVEGMKEKFSKLLLGEDATGGRNGVSPALALSNAITNLAGTVFGELWKLEPLTEDKRNKWRREMDWLLSPTNYMVQLIPAKQCGPDGRTLEIMTPKARVDVHLNLPALQKLDSMLLETLDSMTETEFWYEEDGSRVEGRDGNVKESKRWWLPAPQVPVGGLSDGERKKLLNRAKLVLQIFKAAKSINEAILLEMPIPKIISDALPKSGKASLGEDLYRVLTRVSSASIMLHSLSLNSENSALDAINRLDAAIHAWKDKIVEHDGGKSPARTSWSFRDPVSGLDKTELLINRAENLSREIKIRYPNLPQKFLDVMKIQYGKDVAHAIIEAYSRVLKNLAFSILTRIGDISQEDVLSDPNSPMAKNSLIGVNIPSIVGVSSSNTKARRTLIDKMDTIEGKLSLLKTKEASDTALLSDESNLRSVTATPSTSSGCVGKESYFSSPTDTPRSW